MLIEHIISLLPTFSCAFWTILILLDRLEYGDRGMHTRLLAWSAATTVLYACHAVYFIHSPRLMVVADTVYVYCNLAVYPLYARYLLHLTTAGTSRRTDALLLLPPMVLGLVVAVLYGLMDADSRQLFVDRYLYGATSEGLSGLALMQAVVHTACKVLFAVGVVATLVTGIRTVGRYNNMVDSIFADNEDKHLWGLSRMLYAVAVVSVMSLAANAIGKSWFSHSYLLLALPSVLFTIVLFALAYIGYKNTYSFHELRQMLPTGSEELVDDTTQASPPPATAAENPQENADINTMTDPQESKALDSSLSLAAQLEQVVKEEELYLVRNLKVDDLANRLCTNARYVQRAFNEDIGMPFAEYINRLRIAHTQELLRQNPDMKVYDACTSSGFGSLSTYYRNLQRYEAK